MQSSVERRYTVDDYFAVEESSNIKHEFYNGQIFAMAGASLQHNRIAGNVFAMLRAALTHSGCEVFASDLRLHTPSGLYTYPDVMVVCGGVELAKDDRLDTVTNPLVIVEVLSDSTKDYGEKLRHYKSLPTLREYILIEQSMVLVEHHSLQADTSDWVRREHTAAGDRVILPSLGLTIALEETYAGADLDVRTR